MLDIMDIKKAVNDKQIVFFVRDGKIYCRWHNDNGEVICLGVCVGEVDNDEYKRWMKESGLSMAPADGSKPEIYDCEDKVWRSDVLDLFGHGTMYTSKEAQRMIKDLPSADGR